MFERYTERALRVLFFARRSVSERGSTAIQPEHLLLGLLREDNGLSGSILRPSKDALEKEIISVLPAQAERIAENVEIPFSAAMQDVLNAARKEADQLRHEHIGDEHLFLGLLSEGTSIAASVLIANGLKLEAMREAIIATGSRPDDRERPLKNAKGRLEIGSSRFDA